MSSEIGCEEKPGILYDAAIEQAIAALKTELAPEACSRLNRGNGRLVAS